MNKTCILKIAGALCAAAALAGCATTGVQPAPRSEMERAFAATAFVSSGGVALPLRLYVPAGRAPRSLPLVVYLHGAGQNGTDNEGQLDSSLGRIYSFATERDDLACVVAAPQCPPGSYWREDRNLEALAELVESLSGHPAVDPRRVCVTGFSMGGDATWKLVMGRPDIMSAAVPVCGGPLASMEPDDPDVPPEAADLSIWAFNMFDDKAVRPAFAKKAFAQLWSMDPAERLNFTEYPSGGHRPDQVYSDRDVLIWMTSAQRRGGKAGSRK